MPNVILIVADDLGMNDLNHGAGVGTPNIDSLRRNGVDFVNAYSGHATWYGGCEINIYLSSVLNKKFTLLVHHRERLSILVDLQPALVMNSHQLQNYLVEFSLSLK